MTDNNCTDYKDIGEGIMSSLDCGVDFQKTACLTPLSDFNGAATPAAQDMLTFVKELSQDIV